MSQSTKLKVVISLIVVLMVIGGLAYLVFSNKYFALTPTPATTTVKNSINPCFYTNPTPPNFSPLINGDRDKYIGQDISDQAKAYINGLLDANACKDVVVDMKINRRPVYVKNSSPRIEAGSIYEVSYCVSTISRCSDLSKSQGAQCFQFSYYVDATGKMLGRVEEAAGTAGQVTQLLGANTTVSDTVIGAGSWQTVFKNQKPCVCASNPCVTGSTKVPTATATLKQTPVTIAPSATVIQINNPSATALTGETAN